MAITIGSTYGALTVIARLTKGEVLCRCRCGVEESLRSHKLTDALYWNRCWHKKVANTPKGVTAEFLEFEEIESESFLTQIELTQLIPNACLEAVCYE